MPRTRTLPDEAILAATGRVISRIGPARFTLAHVTAETGLSPATLLQRFSSKRGLLVAFANFAAEGAAHPFRQSRARHRSPLAALRHALRTVAADSDSRQEVANGLAFLIEDLQDEDLRAAAARHAEATERSIRELLDEAVATGELIPHRTRRTARAIQVMWNGSVIQWALREGGGGLDGWLDEGLRTLLEPLYPRE